jgi:hypothetical protein
VIAWLIGTRLGRFVAWALAGIAAVLLVRADAKRDARQEAEQEALRRKVKTLERINEADTSTGDDAADREWLRNRGLRGIGKRDSHL